MSPILLRAVLGLVLVLALLEGVAVVDCRPHSTDSAPAPDSNPTAQDFGNQLGTRHHNHHHSSRHHRQQPGHAGHGHGVRHRSAVTTRSKQQLCGSKLSDALRAICAGRGYYSPADNGPGSSTSRYRSRGITNECCHMGCTMDDLEQYCQPRKTPAPSSEADETAEVPDTIEPSSSRNNEIRQSTESAESTADTAQEQEPRQPLQPLAKPNALKAVNELDLVSRLRNVSESMIRVGQLPQRLHRPVVIIPRQPPQPQQPQQAH